MTFLDPTFDNAWDDTTSPLPAVRDWLNPWVFFTARLDALPQDGATEPNLNFGQQLDWEDTLERCTDRGGIVALIRMLGFQDIADRIAQLLEFEADLEPDEMPINLASLKGFADFLRKERRLEHPAQLSVAPDGFLIAEWHYGSNRHLAIKFLDREIAKFASIAPSRSDSARTRSINGTAPWAEAVDSLSAIHVTRWRSG